MRHAGGSTRRQRGVTLIEATVVLAVTAITAGAVAPGLRGFIEKHELEGAASQLASDLQFARAEAVWRNTGLRLSLQSQSWGACYVVHTGAAGQCRCRESGPAQCDGDAVELKTVQLPAADHVALVANVSSILFDPLHGTSSPTATFGLSTPSGRAVNQVVNLMGRVRTCSPRGTVPGLPVC